MKKVLFATLVAVLALTAAGCNADLRGNAINTNITFTIEAFHQTTLDPVVPLIDVVAVIPGYAAWHVGDETYTPYQFTIRSTQYAAASRQVEITAQLVNPDPNVVLRCTWVAQTPSGVRLSRDSTGGEGESSSGAPVTCKYFA